LVRKPLKLGKKDLENIDWEMVMTSNATLTLCRFVEERDNDLFKALLKMVGQISAIRNMIGEKYEELEKLGEGKK
jgi:hypothetical protein